MNVQIRSEGREDAASIEEVVLAAFATAPHADHTEHLVVRKLRRRNKLALSLVAEVEGEIVGHLAASPVAVDGAEVGWLGIGPVAVVPERQSRGIGTQLMRAALEALKEQGAGGCVVLGDPAYYRRFGFEAHPGLVLEGVPPAYFQALPFSGEVPRGSVTYDRAFSVNV